MFSLTDYRWNEFYSETMLLSQDELEFEFIDGNPTTNRAQASPSSVGTPSTTPFPHESSSSFAWISYTAHNFCIKCDLVNGEVRSSVRVLFMLLLFRGVARPMNYTVLTVAMRSGVLRGTGLTPFMR